MVTWYDIKLATMQKMFSAEGDTYPVDESTVDYVAAMPAACNEALQLLSTAGKFIIKSVSIAHFPVPNLLDENTAKSIHTIYEDEVFEVGSSKVKSYALDVLGIGKMEIIVGEDIVKTVNIDSPTSFIELKDNVLNVDGKNVTLRFSADRQISVKAIGCTDVISQMLKTFRLIRSICVM